MMNPLISTTELADLLEKHDVVLLDATFTMPGASPKAAELYAQRHIPGAIFFDIDAVADTGSPLPHMLPDPEFFAAAVSAMGISNSSHIIVYDTPGMMSAGRAWWTFRVMGHDRVQVLDGGLRVWMDEARPVTQTVPSPAAVTFTPRFRKELVRDRQQMLDNLKSRSEVVIDARSADRFLGRVPEPREGLRSGHIPHSLNLSFDKLSDPATGRMKPTAELRDLFYSTGLTPEQRVVTTCGSGVTAGALAFGLHLIGHKNVALYDGSWAEWGLPGATPTKK